MVEVERTAHSLRVHVDEDIVKQKMHEFIKSESFNERVR